MKKLILLVLVSSFSVNAAVSTGTKELPKEVHDNIFCVGYTQAIYENTEPDTSVNNEAEAAMQFFYNRDESLKKQYNVDDGLPDSGGGKDTDELNRAFSLGYATYLKNRKPMPGMCIKIYAKAVQAMSDDELMQPYRKN